MHKTGETVTVQFCVSDPDTAGLVDADSAPTGTLVLNGVDNAATVTVTNLATGIYRAAVTLPTLTDGDELQLRIAATVGGVDGGGVVWQGYGVTQRPADVLAAMPTSIAAAVAAVQSGTTVTVRRGDALTVVITGLGSLAGRTKLWFTAKTDRAHPDTSALFLIEETAGLVTINGATAVTAANGTLTVDDESAGDITITLAGVETAKLPEVDNGVYDVQILTADGPRTLTDATLEVTLDVTRATS